LAITILVEIGKTIVLARDF